MNDYKCPFAERRKEGFKIWLHCKIWDDVCPFMRYCRTKRDVEHSASARECSLFLKNKNKVVTNDNG